MYTQVLLEIEKKHPGRQASSGKRLARRLMYKWHMATGTPTGTTKVLIRDSEGGIRSTMLGTGRISA